MVQLKAPGDLKKEGRIFSTVDILIFSHLRYFHTKDSLLNPLAPSARHKLVVSSHMDIIVYTDTITFTLTQINASMVPALDRIKLRRPFQIVFRLLIFLVLYAILIQRIENDSFYFFSTEINKNFHREHSIRIIFHSQNVMMTRCDNALMLV